MSGLASTSTFPNSHNAMPIPSPFPAPKPLTLLKKQTLPPKSTTSPPQTSPPGDEGAPKVKPCCVCKEEKAARDECMLFSTAKDPQAACADMVTKYRACMKGFGFDLA